MATGCYTQLGFGFQPKLVVDFTGGELTSDAGLVLLREFDETRGLTDEVVARIEDRRDRRYITHAVAELLRQRVYQIAAGYEDVNDATALRTDPTFQTVAARGDATPLGSQPTLSRFETTLAWSSIRRLANLGIDWFCTHAHAAGRAPHEILLDLDSTDDPTHGAQQLALFVGHYDQFMYRPLCWFEGHTGLPLRTRLRPGRDPDATGVIADLEAMVPKLRRRFPRAHLALRADAGMATPAVEAKLEAEAIGYVLGIGANTAFTRRIADLRAQAEQRYARTQRPVAIRTSFRHRATRWPRQRRILVKLDVTATGTSVRYMVTNRPGRAADLIHWYEGRGTAENRIKELKRDVHADRLSCHRYRANAARLQLHTIALLMLAYYRHWVLATTELATASFTTIRLRLFKVAARVVRSVRRLWFHLASSWPHRTLFCQLHRVLAHSPP
jgi:Transposase DDE domain group 1